MSEIWSKFMCLNSLDLLQTAALLSRESLALPGLKPRSFVQGKPEWAVRFLILRRCYVSLQFALRDKKQQEGVICFGTNVFHPVFSPFWGF